MKTSPKLSTHVSAICDSWHLFFVYLSAYCMFDFSVLFVPSVLWYYWLSLLTCKNRLPYNLYCVGGDVKHCLIQSNFMLWANFLATVYFVFSSNLSQLTGLQYVCCSCLRSGKIRVVQTNINWLLFIWTSRTMVKCIWHVRVSRNEISQKYVSCSQLPLLSLCLNITWFECDKVFIVLWEVSVCLQMQTPCWNVFCCLYCL